MDRATANAESAYLEEPEHKECKCTGGDGECRWCREDNDDMENDE